VLWPRAPRPSRVSLAVGGNSGCGGESLRRRWRRAAQWLGADEVRVRDKVRARGWGLQASGLPSPVLTTLERGWGRREAKRWRWVPERGGRQLDKWSAKDRGGVATTFFGRRLARLAHGGSGCRIQRRELLETGEECGTGEWRPSAILGDFVAEATSKSAPSVTARNMTTRTARRAARSRPAPSSFET
jgi:hypothetical protein